MMRRSLLLSCLVPALLAGCNAPASKSTAAVPPSPEVMMEAMMRAGTPVAAHRNLDAFVGTWDARVTMWMDPSAPPEVSTGRMTTSWILDGRYLEQRFEGNFGGEPFMGISTMGYDVAAEEYVGTWIDSMSTAISYSTGTASNDGKTFTMAAEGTDPISGDRAHGEHVIQVESNDRHSMTMYDMSSGERVKSMLIEYTRVR